jgi:predicted GNAT family N-acyltransferase
MNESLVVAPTKTLSADELCGLFRHAPLASRRSSGQIQQMLCNTFAAVVARRGERLIGFGRAWGDGVYRAVVDDIVVAPEERSGGVGKEIITCLLRECRHVEEVSLTCRDEVVAFYEQFGFRRYSGAHMKRAPQ